MASAYYYSDKGTSNKFPYPAAVQTQILQAIAQQQQALSVTLPGLGACNLNLQAMTHTSATDPTDVRQIFSIAAQQAGMPPAAAPKKATSTFSPQMQRWRAQMSSYQKEYQIYEKACAQVNEAPRPMPAEYALFFKTGQLPRYTQPFQVRKAQWDQDKQRHDKQMAEYRALCDKIEQGFQ
eukprot:TRINITY_DN15001_c0_g1_i1.p1 TRINITY_DN15001_c0_g1~~TRINITY_DN15001_c0_g1_i1.p1  ORF type:complete len:180 (+),score=11.14 TRINITY_DN15001_c0_g1_i1:23-562(+)